MANTEHTEHMAHMVSLGNLESRKHVDTESRHLWDVPRSSTSTSSPTSAYRVRKVWQLRKVLMTWKTLKIVPF